jgi:hypothetical protein
MNELDDVLESLHNDKVAVLREQLAAIDAQEKDRVAIDEQIKGRLETSIGEVRADELHVSPDRDSSQGADVQREARVQFLFKRLDLLNRLSDEMRQCWSDYQRLEEQKREIQRELTLLGQRRDRTNAA